MLGTILFIQLGLFTTGLLFFIHFPNSTVLMLTVHLLVAPSAALAFSHSLGDLYPRRTMFLFGSILAFFLPLAGAGCLFLVTFMHRVTPRRSGDLLRDVRRYMMQENAGGQEEPPLGERREFSRTGTGVEPLIDILAAGDISQRCHALDRIARRRSPHLFQMLMAAREDCCPEIRQFAMSRVTLLQSEYFHEIGCALEAAEMEPENPEVKKRVARAFEMYLGSGLAGNSVRAFLVDQLGRTYEDLLTACPKDGDTMKRYAGLLLDAGRLRDAERAYRDILARYPDDIEAGFGLMKLFYEKKDYAGLFEHIQNVKTKTPHWASGNPDVEPWIAWWLAPERAETGTAE